jgi:hypothetical protein
MPVLPVMVCAGVRKEFDVEGRQVLMFWYRNAIYAIEARSPAEGAYSEGFIRAKFTQVGAGPAHSQYTTFGLLFVVCCGRGCGPLF